MAISLFVLGVVLGVVCGVLFMLYRQQQRQAAEKALDSPSRSPDLLRISQRAIGYPLLIEIEGARYWSVSEIVESDHRALLFAAARTLLAQIPREHLEAVMPPPSSEVEAEPPPAQVARPSAPPPSPPPTPPTPASPPSRAAAPLSTVMIKEIDELFQAILQTMPNVPEAGLMAAADGSMLIKVGSHYYRSVDEIAHPQVRQALRQAIKQWEARL